MDPHGHARFAGKTAHCRRKRRNRSGAHKLGERRNHWAWQPVQSPKVPEVQHPNWASHPCRPLSAGEDEKKELSPSAPAQRQVLVRRLKIALLGLPPTPEEVAAFVEDTRPRAYERLVERFLRDPAFGENWAAHWLDLMRFARNWRVHSRLIPFRKLGGTGTTSSALSTRTFLMTALCRST